MHQKPGAPPQPVAGLEIEMSNEFISYTIGLMATRGERAKLVKVEYSKNADGGVTLQVVSGHNLEKTAGKKSISTNEFSARPNDPYDSVIEAKWALLQCGWSIDTPEESE